MRIGVLSDTHIPGRGRSIPARVLTALIGVDLILHAGDLVKVDVLEALMAIAPVAAVAGNNDGPELADRLGTALDLTLAGYRIGMAHGHLGKGKSTVERALSHFHGADCVVFGHSHTPYCAMHGQTLAFNPGSPTDRRRAPACAFGFLYLEPNGIRAEHVLLEPEK